MRAITPLAGYEPGTPCEPGPAPQLMWVAVADLVIDDSYQRPLERRGRANVTRIAEGFDWSKFAPLIVAPVVGGKLAVIDGQHRATAAAARGFEQLPAMVVIADRARQAESFAAVNGQTTKITPQQIFKSQLAAGKPEAAELQAACREGGITLLMANQKVESMNPGETLALGALRSALERLGRSRLVTLLRCLNAAAGEASGLVNASSIKAVSQLLETRPDWTEAALFAAFIQIDLETEMEEARVQAARFRRPAADVLADRLRPQLNKALDEKVAA